MNAPTFQKIYDLHEDQARIQRIQEATLHTTDFGFRPDHGVFGSDDWWQAIERGLIPIHVKEGVIGSIIEDVTWGPACEVTSSSGTTQWDCLGDPTQYITGRNIRIRYVIQHVKRGPGGVHRLLVWKREALTAAPVILEVWIESGESIPGAQGTR